MENYITEKEVWKDIKGYEGLYQVSNFGRVWSCRRNKILSHRVNKGYYLVNLSKDGKQETKQVHRIVGETFIPNPLNKPEINHIDENKLNNHVSNLEWVTPKENTNWGTRNKRISEYVKNNPVEGRGMKTKRIYQIDPKTNKILAEYESVKDALKALGANPKSGTLSTCLTGNGPNKTYKGYKWKYADEVTQ